MRAYEYRACSNNIKGCPSPPPGAFALSALNQCAGMVATAKLDCQYASQQTLALIGGRCGYKSWHRTLRTTDCRKLLKKSLLFCKACRPAIYNHTSAVLSDARGARSLESCCCMHEVCHASSGGLCTVKLHGGLHHIGHSGPKADASLYTCAKRCTYFSVSCRAVLQGSWQSSACTRFRYQTVVWQGSIPSTSSLCLPKP